VPDRSALRQRDRPDHPLLEAIDVRKSFGSVDALRGASLTVDAGEVVALVGDNGAGKSTFAGVLSGALLPDDGDLRIGGEACRLESIDAAERLGISTVYQDLALAPDLTVAENMFLSRELRRPGLLGRLGFMRARAMSERSAEMMESLGIKLPSALVPVQALSGGQRQVVAIGRALLRASRVVIMDEPTAALGARQSEIVIDTIERTRERGLGVLLISHDLPRVCKIADRVAVMRHGRVIAVRPSAGLTVPKIVGLMLGEEVGDDATEVTASAAAEEGR
jgi:ABC-type sugar transport system ATPase subunit